MKANIKMGRFEYSGTLEVDCFFTDQQWWKFEFSNPHFNKVDVLSRFNFPTREAALEDARAHGIEIEE